MAQVALEDGSPLPTLATSYIPQPTSEIMSQPHQGLAWRTDDAWSRQYGDKHPWWEEQGASRLQGLGSTGKGILIGMLSAFGSAALVALVVAIVYFFRYTNRGRILLDRIGRPGEFDDEQQFLREEEEALAEMDDMQRAEYQRAKGR